MNSKNILPVGQIMLTASGVQLAKVCKAEKYSKYLSYILNKWQKLGFQINKLTESNFEDRNKLILEEIKSEEIYD